MLSDCSTEIKMRNFKIIPFGRYSSSKAIAHTEHEGKRRTSTIVTGTSVAALLCDLQGDL